MENMTLKEVEERITQLNTEFAGMEDAADINKATEELRALKERKSELEDLEARKAEAEKIANGEVVGKVTERKGEIKVEKRTFAVDSKEYREAFLKNLMGKDLDTEERAAVKANAVIPTETMNMIVEKLESSPLLQRIDITNIAGNLTIPVEKATADAQWKETSTDSADEIGALALGANKLIKTIEIGADVEAMSISAFEQFVVNKLTIKLERAIQNAVLNGTGTNQPTGVLKAITSDLTFTKAGVTYKDLLAIMAKVPGEYHNGATWTIPSAVFFNEVLGMVDANKRPIVVLNPVEGAGYTLMGHAVDLVDDAADTITFGNYSAYKFNFAKGIEITSDASVGFRSGSVVYRGMALCDGGVADTAAITFAKRATS